MPALVLVPVLPMLGIMSVFYPCPLLFHRAGGSWVRASDSDRCQLGGGGRSGGGGALGTRNKNKDKDKDGEMGSACEARAGLLVPGLWC